MSEYTLFVKRIGLVGVAKFLVPLRGLIILPILTKTLGASDYGIWSQILITILVLGPLLRLGMDNAIVRFLPAKQPKEIVQGVITASFIVLIIGGGVSIVLFVSAGFLAETFLNDQSATYVIRFATPLIVMDALKVLVFNTFRLLGQIKRYSAIELLQAVLEIGLITFFVLSGHGLYGAVTALLITRFVTLATMFYLIFSHAGFTSPDFSILRPYLKYGLPLVPSILFQFLIDSSDRYVIGFVDGATSVGIYSAAYNIGAMVLMYGTTIMYVLSPTIFDAFDKGETEKVKGYISYSWRYLLILSIPSAIGLAVLAEPLLTNLTTREFVSTGRSIVPLVTFGLVLYGLSLIFEAVILLHKKSKIVGVVVIASGLTNLVLNILLVHRFGIVAAAITTIIAYGIMMIAFCFISRKYLRFDFAPDIIVKSLLSSGVMALVIWAIAPVAAYEVVLSVIGGGIVYFAVLFLLGGIGMAEIRFLLQVFGWNSQKFQSN
ncbi:MAG: flippase [Planctomycetes bacterium]|nr:flippase [Planctomycetota bacterium]